jgi:iron complex outermembrane receptor protein
MLKSFAATLACGVCVMALANPAQAQSRAFNIPAGDLNAALDLYIRQSGHAVIYDADQVRGIKTAGVSGGMPPEQALDRLLAGTAFHVQRNANGAVAVVRVGRGAAVDNATAAEAANGAGAPEIVVTASKREQKLRDVPSAITVLSGSMLDAQGVGSVRDYVTLTPGLSYSDEGHPGIGSIIMRGLTTGQGSNATAVVYLDDVNFTSSSSQSGSGHVAPNPELADIDRIEVLKGPQGTLYGASNLGGVVRIIAKRPDATRFSGSARLEGTAIDGGGTGYAGRITLNIPLITDQLAVRATGFYRREPGYVDNVGTNTKNVNDAKSYGARVALGWTPTEKLTVDLVGSLSNTTSNGVAQQDDITGTFTPVYGKRKYSQFFNQQSKIKYRLASGTINYETGLGKIVAAASYLDSQTAYEFDETQLYGPYLPLLGYPTGTGLPLTQGINLKKDTAEVRFVSNRLGPIEFVVGGFQTHEHTVAPTVISALNIATGQQLAGLAGTLISATIDDTYNEYAGFGNVTYYLTSTLDLTGGIRYAHNSEASATTFGGLLEGAPILPPQLANFKDNVLTYLATLRWRPTETFSTFLRAASGYRPGGPQTNPTPPAGAQTRILPDAVWNYEAGFKGDFLDRKLSVEASGYHIDWKNIPVTSYFGGIALLANAGKAVVNGAEFQLVYRPSRLLTISANAGYTDAHVAQISAGATQAIGAFKGDPLPLTPKWTMSAIADQRIPLSEGVDGLVGATLRYQSTMTNSWSQSPTNIDVKLPAITTVDLRAGVRVQRYRLQARVQNLFNRNALTNYQTVLLFAGQGLPSQAIVARPRSFTLALDVDF